jgi:pimeloyl-ACP methyl ester carboxylesterase
LLRELLDSMGLEQVHFAGNSLGGWTGLELALLGRVRSVVAIGPAGLWRRSPIRPVILLSAMHRIARRLGRLAPHVLKTDLGRQVVLGRAVGQPRRVPPDDAVAIVDAFARASSFEATLIATHMRRFEGGRGIDVPVTIVFGQRDRIVPAAARLQDELPAHVRWLEPPGLGHVPMWDDPNLVARIILA